MMEIDLPRMQSLSPRLDSPLPLDDTFDATSNLNTDISSCQSDLLTEECDWKCKFDLCGCKGLNKSECGCKYINKTHQSPTEHQQMRGTVDFIVPSATDSDDLFATYANHFIDSESVLEQNLADIEEYDDLNGARSNDSWNLNHVYAVLALKDELPEVFNDNQFDLLGPFRERGGQSGLLSPSTSNDDGAHWRRSHTREMFRNSGSPTLNLTRVIEWSEYFANGTKSEKNDPEDSAAESSKLQSSSADSVGDAKEECIKSECGDDQDKNSTSGFSSNVELSEEESEIIEVLWKQDVDLGYTLAPVKASLSKEAANSSTATSSAAALNPEDNEKLKALQELKNEKSKQEENKTTSDDEWAGINFTVDNETGEYIQLPLQLEEILQDVLQLADLANDNDQVDEILSEQLNTSEYSNVNTESSTSASASGSSHFGANFAFPIDELTSRDLKLEKDKQKEQNDDTDNNLQLLLDSPLTEEELSADLSAIINEASELDELDMMIQSASPFQHPRSVAQNYIGHGNGNIYHRQPSYHAHHPQSRLSLSRQMERSRLDIASLFSPLPGMGVGMNVSEMASYSHYPPHYSYQGATSLPQHDQYAAHQHMALQNVGAADMGAHQAVGSMGSNVGALPSQPPHYATPNLGTAVSSSMHLTNASHDNEVLGATSNYKADHEMMYFSNTSSELNHTTEAYFNSFLCDDDILAIDMGGNVNVNNDGFYMARPLELNSTSNNSSMLNTPTNAAGGLNNNGASILQNASGVPSMQTVLNGNSATGDRLDASSDSAVSSMGSERVPSLSDGEWGDTGSDSAQDYHHGKYGPYDYSSYNARLGDAARHPVAQKKHQMFGKRYLQDQNTPNMTQQVSNPGVLQAQQPDIPIKYEFEPYPMHHALASSLDGSSQSQQQQQSVDMKYSIDFARHAPRVIHDIVAHNHTYTLPQASGAMPRSQTRDKKNSKKSDEEHLSRDEKRARALDIPIPVSDIINLPMDEFNERLSKYDLNENQLSLIRDIRRRGKNKVAAQNCRKRKLDQILSLADEVEEVCKRKDRLVKEQQSAEAERNRVFKKFEALHKHIFQNLRDPQGNLYSPSEWTLHQSIDGGVHLLRREPNNQGQVNTQLQQSHQSQNPQQPGSQQSNSTHHISHHHHNPHEHAH